MGETDISWTHRPGTVGRSWNPGQGCSRVSTGCERCYAERMAARFAKDGWSQGLINLKTGKWNGHVRLAPHKLAEPLRWRQPSTVFVNSMTDMFHEKYTNEEIAAVFGVMAACPQHTFQMLTKRAKRMRGWFEWVGDSGTTKALRRCGDAAHEAGVQIYDPLGKNWQGRTPWNDCKCVWPLPNLWIGCSVENQSALAERVPHLEEVPAVVRFLSCEPLLGALDFSADALRHIQWIIGGCESGHGARPCATSWLRSLRDQCAAAGVPFFLKQAQESVDLGEDRLPDIGDDDSIEFGEGSTLKGRGPDGIRIVELPYLDGRQHQEWPNV